jgi:aminoglycoside 6'-N-acetyltransferase I
VRRARPEDRGEWLRMRRELWPHAADEHAREVEDHLRSAASSRLAFVAEAPGRDGLVGFLEARLREYAEGCASSPVACIEGWYASSRER